MRQVLLWASGFMVGLTVGFKVVALVLVSWIIIDWAIDYYLKGQA